jgi:hypothetical protein
LAGYGAFPKLANEQPGKGDMFIQENLAQFFEGCCLNFKEL